QAVTGSTTLKYAYDANGALLSRKLGNTTQQAYTYNDDGRLATVAGVTLKYNAFGQRQTSTVSGGGGIFIFGRNGLLLAEYTPLGVLMRNYIYLEGKPFAIENLAGDVFYILNDQVSQPQKMLYGSPAAVAWQRVAGIFGNTVSQPVGATSANPQRFPGQQEDPTSALYYNYFRDYDPATGRYIEPDPIGLNGGINLYTYVEGNPTRRVDRFGLYTEAIFFKPVGWFASSFGHVAVNINGTVYSWNTNGMAIEPKDDYLDRNKFRDALGFPLSLTHAQENQLEGSLRSYGKDHSYDKFSSNCTDPLQHGLEELGYPFGAFTPTPSQIRDNLVFDGLANGNNYNYYPANPADKAPWWVPSAPWTPYQ
ncbi:RHS repeat-associated core domain-containing protein, partial [Mesorhizobium sp. M0030]|uniref:RHS repeat-associated core domain-containing protein n=1 Tax=Mesorhizobium sp. M0030 TaxID=2956851 RepID=UPI00333C7852